MQIESEYAPLFKDYGLGTTTWSPLASGTLSGKYLDQDSNTGRLKESEMLKKMPVRTKLNFIFMVG